MSYFADIQEFIELSQRSTNVEELATLFGATIRRFGFDRFACCSHVDPLRPPEQAVMIADYPEDWITYFSERGYDRLDPVFETCQSRSLPFRWSDPSWRAHLTAKQVEILEEASEAGLKDGFSVPIHSATALPASCSMSLDGRDVDPAAVNAVHLIAVYLHEAARRSAVRLVKPERPALSPRQKQCLELAAQGKSDWAISRILGVSESTVHHHMITTLRKMGVATRAQAIVKALFQGDIRFLDILIEPERVQPERSGADREFSRSAKQPD